MKTYLYHSDSVSGLISDFQYEDGVDGHFLTIVS